MENSNQSDHNLELIYRAEQTIDGLAYTEQEKLTAIEFLQHVPMEEAVRVLKKATEMFSWGLFEGHQAKEFIQTVDEELPNIPISGAYLAAKKERAKYETHSILESSADKMMSVIEVAARALARNTHPRAMMSLEYAIRDPNVNPETRYISTLALGGVTSKAAFETLSIALKDKHPMIRHRAVLSLKESLDALNGGGLHRTEVVNALRGCVELAYGIYELGDLLKDKGILFARFIVQQKVQIEVEHAIISIFPKLKTDNQIELLVEHLNKLDLSLESIHELAKIIVMPNLPLRTYKEIAKILKSKKDPQVCAIAQSVRERKAGFCTRLISFFFGRQSDPILEAAEEILDEKTKVQDNQSL